MTQPVGRTRHGELTLDQIANMMPGMAELMLAIGQRYQVMVHAGQQENWQLAAYQLGAIRKLFNTAKVTRPKFTEVMGSFVAEFLEPIAEAIRQRDRQRFDAGVAASVAASDRYHREWGYEYIRFRVAAQPPAGYDLADESPAPAPTR